MSDYGCSRCADYDGLKREVTNLNEVLHRKNLELDALHMVWCDGGCPSGVHRWSDAPVTEEIVLAAERNTERLRRWFNTVKWRLEKGIGVYGEDRMRAKIGQPSTESGESR